MARQRICVKIQVDAGKARTSAQADGGKPARHFSGRAAGWLAIVTSFLTVTVGLLPAFAGPRRLLHEPLPDLGDLASLLTPRHDQLVADPAKTAAKGPEALPDAIRTSSGLIAQPPAAKPGDKTPVYAPKPPPQIGVDRRTGADLELHYQVVFDPTVAPFKRDFVYDGVGPQGQLLQSGRGMRDLVPGGEALPGRELFWGHVRVQLEVGVPTQLPSVAPDSRILRYEAVPTVPLQFRVDSAGNQYVQTTGSATEVDLRWLTDAPSTYFAAPLGDGPPPAVQPQAMALDAGLQARMQELWPALGVRPDQPRSEQLRQLVLWFRSFEPGEPPPASSDPLRDLVVAQKGVCRHRALGFLTTALSLGIPVHYVMNDAHAFAEAWSPLQDGTWGWQRIDLGGGSDSLELHATENKRLHQPLHRDPFPRPASYTSATGQVLADGKPVDNVWGGASNVKGTEQLANVTTGSYDASEPGEAAAGPSSADPAGPGSAGHSPATVVDDARRSWLRQRAQAQAAAPAPPTATPPARAQEEARQPSQLLLETEAEEAWLGEALTLRGRLASSDKGLSRQAVEVWLIDPQRPLQARLLGALVTDVQGRYAGAVRLPVDLPPAEYDVVARFAGSAAHAPADSERAPKTR
jgi:hypothetical protein